MRGRSLGLVLYNNRNVPTRPQPASHRNYRSSRNPFGIAQVFLAASAFNVPGVYIHPGHGTAGAMLASVLKLHIVELARKKCEHYDVPNDSPSPPGPPTPPPPVPHLVRNPCASAGYRGPMRH